jgi:hypothetical protein
VGELAAAGAAAALAAMLFASRLPPGAQFIVPRRGGFALYRAAWALFATSWGRTAFSAVIALVLAACAGLFAAALRREVREWPREWSARVGLAAGPAFALVLAGRLVGHSLDLIQSVWFPYGGLDARELPVAFVLFGLTGIGAVLASCAWAGGRRARATALFAALIAVDLSSGLLAAVCGVGQLPAVPAASGKTVFVVLTEGEHGPGREVYALTPDIFTDPDPRPALTSLAARTHDARALPALRALYEEETKRWDLDGLRSSLLLGAARRDPLAVSVLLANLGVAVPSPAVTAALGAIADTDAWRIGPMGAAAISRAYARSGDRETAARWAEKAGGPAGIAAGLLGTADGGALHPGRIAGVVRAPGSVRVALYAKSDPGAPYMLDAAGFVAAAQPDARGRFGFSGLTAGRYYLAVALSSGDGRRGEVSVTGSRGDLVLDARRPVLDLPPLTIKFTPR